MFEPISVSLAPNQFKDDVLLAGKLVFQPANWLSGEAAEKLEKLFCQKFGFDFGKSFVSGRTALYAILKALGVGKDDEVIMQSFTCVVVANAILALGARPIFADINRETFNLDIADIEKKITKKTKVIIFQHTFGLAAGIEEVAWLAKKRKILLVEDCAHGLGFSYKGKQAGSWGEAAFFSFGRDKAISSVFGGMAVTGNRKTFDRINEIWKEMEMPSNFFVFQQLMHPLLFSLILPLYDFFSAGKIILVLGQIFGLLSKPVFAKEKRGIMPKKLLAKMPNALAELACKQVLKVEEFNEKRKWAVWEYSKGLGDLGIELPTWRLENQAVPLLRMTIKTKRAQELYVFAKEKGVILNNWYYPEVSPAGVDLEKIGYRPEVCPEAEKTAPLVVNLPTHPRLSEGDVKKVISVIREFFRK